MTSEDKESLTKEVEDDNKKTQSSLHIDFIIESIKDNEIRSRQATISDLFLNKAQEVDALGALNGQAQSAIPDQLGKGTKGTADTEGDSVVERLLEAEVVEEDTTGGINVGVGVLGLWEEC
jgi:hypothetical protein